MRNKSIFITGCAGFIGFHLAKKFLENNYEVSGVDNLNNYYDIKLKKDRLAILKKFKKFKFKKLDISKKNILKSFVKIINPKIFIHLAAQAGVRYSLVNPEKYFKSNIEGFFNILEIVKEQKINKFIFASSSSVYGNINNLPYNEDSNTSFPESFYASTKKANEVMAFSYSQNYNIKTICLRFFTVYGPYGRPDMSLFSFTNKMLKNKSIPLFNKGKHIRDFTYIDDVVTSLFLVTKKLDVIKNKSFYQTFNIGNSKPVYLKKYLDELSKVLNIKPKVNFLNFQKGEVLNTHSDTSRLIKFINFTPNTPLTLGLKKFIDWYKEYYK